MGHLGEKTGCSSGIDGGRFSTHSLNLALFGFAPGTYKVFVKAVGQPSIINNMSAGVTYTVPTGTPRVQITSPYNGQHAGPATNLIAQAMSPNGAIIEYQVYLDRNLVRTLGGGPSFQAWISTSMGIHTIVVKAEDCDHQWSSASVWIDRTY